jgi:hypothetical protein
VTTPEAALRALRASWSRETSRHWRPDDPARGQCNVSALVVHDLLGGDIVKTGTPDGWHFYNRVGGVRWDVTESQFVSPPSYEDVPSDRREALSGTTLECYQRLAGRVRSLLPGAVPHED